MMYKTCREKHAPRNTISLTSFSLFLILWVSFPLVEVLSENISETQLKSMDLPIPDLQDKLSGAIRRVVVERAELRRANGKLVEMERTLVRKTNYDSEGRQREEVIYDPRGVVFRETRRFYDPTGDLQEVRTYTPDGLLICRQVYNQDPGNRSIKEVAYEGNEITETVYSLDENGKVVGQTTLDSIAEMSIRLHMQYDANGRLSEISTCVSDSKRLTIVPGGPDGTSVILSDEMRHRIKGVGPCSDGLLTSRTVLSRDDSGHLVEVAVYSGEGILVERYGHSREYDAHGNWIKETQTKWKPESNRFEPVALTYRRILYR